MNIQGSHPLFNQFWEKYPKKADKYSASKAFAIMMEVEGRIDFDRFLKCVELYAKIQHPSYYSNPGNWIREDKWKDLYFEESLDLVLAKHHEKVKTAEVILDQWAEAQAEFKWWHPVRHRQLHLLRVTDGLNIKFVRDHWAEALAIAKLNFAKPFTGNDWRANTRPSIDWFIREETIARLIEGHYGRTKEKKFKAKANQLGGGHEVEAEPEDAVPVKELLDDFWAKMKKPKPKNPFLK